MKIGWGYLVTIGYLGFAIMMAYLVYRSTQLDFDLVREDYYKHELNYQKRVDQLQNTAHASKKVDVVYKPTEQTVIFTFPKDQTAIQGDITLYRPSNDEWDQKIPIQLTRQIQKISVAEFPKGLWKALINWEAEGTSYYMEKMIIVQ